MQVRVLGGGAASAVWSRSGCLLLGAHIAFDTGGLVSQLSPLEQACIDDIFITHAHLDHVGELAFLIDNVMTVRTAPLQVWAPAPVIAVLRQHLFNNQLWPDFSMLRIAGRQVLEFRHLPDGGRLALGEFEIRWARTNHPVFSVGYLVSAAARSFLYTGDTGPTAALWKLANQAEQLQAVFVETAFPNRLLPLAHAAGHLTPALLGAELTKLRSTTADINIMHVKPVYQTEIEQELLDLHRPCRILEGGEQFRYPSGS